MLTPIKKNQRQLVSSPSVNMRTKFRDLNPASKIIQQHSLDMAISQNTMQLDRIKMELSEFLNKGTLGFAATTPYKHYKFNKSHQEYENLNKKFVKVKLNPYKGYSRQNPYRRKKQQHTEILQNRKQKIIQPQDETQMHKKSFTIKQLKPGPKLTVIKDNIFFSGEGKNLGSYFEMISEQKRETQKKINLSKAMWGCQSRNSSTSNRKSFSLKVKNRQSFDANRKNSSDFIQPWNSRQEHDEIF